jgi:hypothetical protein
VKISEAKVKFESSYFGYAEIRKNPGNISEYIVWLYGSDGKSFMLCYENSSAVSSQELDHLIQVLREVGFRRAKVYF